MQLPTVFSNEKYEDPAKADSQKKAILVEQFGPKTIVIGDETNKSEWLNTDMKPLPLDEMA